MFYINIEKKKLVNSVNAKLTCKPQIEYAIDDLFITFKLLNNATQTQPIADTDLFKLAIDVNFDLQDSPIVYSDTYTIANNEVTFRLNTNNMAYLKKVQNQCQVAVMQIVRKSADDSSYHVICQDEVIAKPRIHVTGTPSPAYNEQFYNKTQIDALLLDKVEKVQGKQLSDENYTLEEKQKLASLHLFTEAEVQTILALINGKQE